MNNLNFLYFIIKTLKIISIGGLIFGGQLYATQNQNISQAIKNQKIKSSNLTNLSKEEIKKEAAEISQLSQQIVNNHKIIEKLRAGCAKSSYQPSKQCNLMQLQMVESQTRFMEFDFDEKSKKIK